MHAQPFFTVAITTYQRPAQLVHAIKSVLAQSFTDYELLIIDDGSQDHTEQVVAALRASDVMSNVRYIRQPHNQGIGAARNVAIQQARAACLVFLDDDDRLASDFLAQVHRAWATFPPTVAFAVAAHAIYRQTAEDEKFIRDITYGVNEVHIKSGHSYLQKPFGTGSGMVVRTSAARAVGGFNTERIFAEDSDFLLRLAMTSDMAVIPHAKFMAYSTSGPHLTKNFRWVAQAREQLADYHRQALRAYPATLVRYYTLGATSYYAIKERQSGRRCIWKALRLIPWSPRTWQRFAMLELHPLLPEKRRHRLFAHPRHGNHTA